MGRGRCYTAYLWLCLFLIFDFVIDFVFFFVSVFFSITYRRWGQSTSYNVAHLLPTGLLSLDSRFPSIYDIDGRATTAAYLVSGWVFTL